MPNNSENEILEQYLDKLNPSIRESLNYEQKKEISHVFKRLIPRAFSLHLIDLRFTFWFFRRWYIVFLFGRDRRTKQRANEGYQKSWLEIVLNILGTIILSVGVLVCLFGLLYFIKSLLGIDIFPDKHLIEFFQR